VLGNRGGWQGTRIDATPLRRGCGLIDGHLSFQLRHKLDALLQGFQDEDCFVALAAAAKVLDFIYVIDAVHASPSPIARTKVPMCVLHAAWVRNDIIVRAHEHITSSARVDAKLHNEF
jgi:hypothetical protein